MFKNRTHWESETSRANFEAGIRSEQCFRRLIIGFFPPKVLRIGGLSFMGYKEVHNIRFSELNKTTFEITAIYCKLSEFLFLGYYLSVEEIGSVEKKHLNIYNAYLDEGLEKHPNV